MSQISATSVAALGPTADVSSAAVSTVGGLTPSSGSAEGGSTSSVSSSTSLSRSAQTYSFSSSQTSLTSATSSANDKLAAMVLALIEIVLGLNNKDKDDDKQLLAGLVGLLALAGNNRSSGGELQYLELNQSSQVGQVTTTMSSSAIQASAYACQAGTATGDGGTTGGSLNVVA